MDYKEYFESKDISLERVEQVAMQRYKVSAKAVHDGAKVLYDKIQSGETMKDIVLAHRIIAEAKPLSRGNTQISPVVKYLEEITKRIEWLENTWHMRLTRFLINDWNQFQIRHSWLFERVEI
jgi:hypothetical protein